MRKLSSLAAVLAAVACGGNAKSPLPPPPSVGCAPPHACPKSCRTPSDCDAGQECNGGYCANPAATLTQFNLCSIDADCSAGDHCTDGACGHDCISDKDCSGGQICDVRGYCTAAANAGQPAAAQPPSPGAPVLSVDLDHVDFDSFGSPATLTVSNTGSAPLRYRLTADQPWLGAQPLTATVPAGGSQSVTVQVLDPARAAGQAGATLGILSSGGSRSIPISIPARLTGLFRGEVTVTSPVAAGRYPLQLALSDDGTSVQGVVDADHSPALAFRAAITGTHNTQDGSYSIAFTVPARSGSRANPTFPGDLGRNVTIAGKMTGPRLFDGTYSETVDGALPSTLPVQISGSIHLRFVGPAPVILPVTDTVQPPAPPTDPGITCSTCPSGACPATDLAAAQEFLGAAFPFYQQFQQAGVSGSPYLPIEGCIGNPSGCYNAHYLQCAESRFALALQSQPNDTCVAPDGQPISGCARRGLLDTFKALMQWRALLANQIEVDASQWATPLNTELPQLDAARVSLLGALLGDRTSSNPAPAIGHPYYLTWLAGLPAAAFDASPSLVPEQLGIGTLGAVYAPRNAGSDFGRVFSTLAAFARTSTEEADVEQRLDYGAGSYIPSSAIAQRATANAYLLAAIFGTVANADGFGGLAPADFADTLTQLAQRSESILDGMNPAGVSDDAIPWLFYPSTPGQTGSNFQAILAAANTAATQAANYEAAARNETRAYEADANQLSNELTNEINSLNGQLARLCGGSDQAPAVQQCGAAQGDVYDATQELQQAYLRVQAASDSVSKAYASIRIEQDRAAQVAGLHENAAKMIMDDGSTLLVLDQEQSDIQTMHDAVSGLGSVIGAINPENPFGMIGALVGMAANLTADSATAQIAAEREDIATREKAQVEFTAMKAELIDSAARVKTMMLDIPGYKIQTAMAQIDAARAAARLRLLLQQAVDVQNHIANVKLFVQGDPRTDPGFREYRDHLIIDADRWFHVAMLWSFYAVRALEYEFNYSSPSRASVFEQPSVSDLQGYLTQLSLEYSNDVASWGAPQSRTAVISLRKDVLGLENGARDPTTGVTYSAADLFHRYVADPRHRDADGSLRIEFSTPIDATSPFFSTSVCNDKVTGLRASLVGAQLGAASGLVELSQRGVANLRSCGATDPATLQPLVLAYDLEATLGNRKALIQAGINLSGPSDPNAPPVNTELYGRPVGAQWVLRIVPQDNKTLELGNLDDVELFLTHDTQTIR